MIDSAIQSYFLKLKNQSPISIEQKNENDRQHQTLPEHLKLNNKFALPLLEESPNVIKVNIPEIGLPKVEGPPITNEKNPDPEDLTSPGQIDMNKVEEYLRLETSNAIDFNIPLFQTINKVECEPYEIIVNPTNYWGRTKDSMMIEITIKEICTTRPSSGFFQLYNQIDSVNLLPISEPLYFDNNHFIQTSTPGLESACIFCAEPKSTIYLLCFLNQKFGNTPFDILFAVSGKQLFCDDANGVVRPRDNLNVFENFLNVSQADIKGKINMITNAPALSNPENLVKQAVKADLQIQLIPCNQYNFTHSWIGNANPQLRLSAVPIDPPSTSPTPIISLFDIEFFFKNQPKENFSYFKAYIVNGPIKNLAAVQGIPLFTTSKPTKESEITSFVVPSSNQISFCENIRIYVNEQINSQTYLAIFLYSFNLEKKEPTLYKVGYIPLFNTSNTIEKGPQKFILYDPKRLPKDLKHQKPPNRTYIQCRISIPPAYFPFPCCEKFINNMDPNNIEFPEGDSDALLTIVVPIFAKMLGILSVQNLRKLVEFLSQFDKVKLKDILRSWAYNIFNPNLIPNCENSLLSSLNSLMEQVSNNPVVKDDIANPQKGRTQILIQMKFLAQNTPESPRSNDILKPLLTQLPIYVDVLIASMYKSNTKLETQNFLSFFRIFARFLTFVYNESSSDDLLSAINSVSTCLFHCMYKFEFTDIAKSMFEILRAIHSMRDPQKLSKNSVITFRFLIRFASTPQFIVGLGTITKRLNIEKSFSPYNKLLSIFFLVIFECLTVDNKEAITLCSRFLKMISFHVEQLPPDIVSHIAYSLFPIIYPVLSDYDSKPIKETPNAQANLIPFILIILNKTQPEVITSFFKNLANTFQLQLITKLISLYETLYRSGVENNLQFFIEMTKRMLQFLHVILDEQMSRKIVLRIIEVCKFFLNDFQSPTTFIYFYHFIKRVIEMFKCERKLIILLLKKVQSRLLSKRCLATALLYHQFWCDYVRNSSIVLSSIDTMDSLTAILLKLDSEDTEIYDQFILAMDKLSFTKNDYKFKEAVHERMGAAQVIINVVREQKKSTYPIEDRCKQIMMIADQYKMFPTMRMKWLQECLNKNKENDDIISAFVSQLHVVALVATVYYYNNYEKQTPNENITDADKSYSQNLPFHLSVVQPIRYAMKVDDNVQDTFKFLPEVAEETKIDFASMNPVALDLLNDMSLNMLITELDRAVTIGLDAGLYYSLRPIHSFILRLRHRTRNFRECANSCTKLSEIFKKITTKSASFTHDTPIAAYLVIDKQNNQIKQSVYYINVSVNVSANRNVNVGDQKIIEILKKDQRREDKVNLCPKHHSIDCKYPGTCVVPLEVDQDTIDNDEHPHHWKHFKTRIYYSDYENTDFNQKEVNVIKITTKSAIPHYRMCVDVNESETFIESHSMIEIIDESMNKTLDVCNKISEDLEMWFINEQNVNHDLTNDQLYSGEVERIITILDEIVKDKKDNFFDRLKRLRQNHKEKAFELANKAREALSRIMKVFSRITKDLPTNMTHYQMFSILISKFCKEFDLEDIPANQMFESYQDPMTQTFEFEK
ncbi:hypothetical protein M9Y10_000060 [Tritrichomonas musculus]|uniref:DOCKER Lobe A domain-containing protein n=1 Tax=Tritrichomonas musculus TaxID=1915356 RepID=A0ABR2L387_9EUKA